MVPRAGGLDKGGRASRGLVFLILVFQAGLMTAVFLFLRCHFG